VYDLDSLYVRPDDPVPAFADRLVH